MPTAPQAGNRADTSPETLRSWLTRTLERPLTPDEERDLPFPPDEADVIGVRVNGDFDQFSDAVVSSGDPRTYAAVVVETDLLSFVRDGRYDLADRHARSLRRIGTGRHLSETETLAAIHASGFRPPSELREKFAAFMGEVKAPPPAEPNAPTTLKKEQGKRKAGGRTPTDPALDTQVAAARKMNPHQSFADLAQSLGRTLREVKLSWDRVRPRPKRKAKRNNPSG